MWDTIPRPPNRKGSANRLRSTADTSTEELLLVTYSMLWVGPCDMCLTHNMYIGTRALQERGSWSYCSFIY